MKPIIAILTLSCSAACAASSLDDAAREVAATQVTRLQVSAKGKTVDLVYVGTKDDCARVGAAWSNGRWETLVVCGNEVSFSGGVAPAFEATAQRWQAWARQAVLNGRTTKKEEGGFQVEARLLPVVDLRCRSIETVVSYEGEFVDLRVHRYC